MTDLGDWGLIGLVQMEPDHCKLGLWLYHPAGQAEGDFLTFLSNDMDHF